MAGREFGVTELVDKLERDRVFFEESGGGVTFSGGEPLSQPEFLKACLHECRKRGLHVAVDTCGLAPRENLLEVAELADLVLYDIKHMDPVQHHRNTGADNRLILENLRALSECEVEITIRVPLIAGVNDGVADIEAVGGFIASLPHPRPIHLLSHHGLASGKLVRLEMADAHEPFRAPDPEVSSAIVERLQSHGLEVTVGGRA
jgi:pyruvate formate lyase activating enzyme